MRRHCQLYPYSRSRPRTTPTTPPSGPPRPCSTHRSSCMPRRCPCRRTPRYNRRTRRASPSLPEARCRSPCPARSTPPRAVPRPTAPPSAPAGPTPCRSGTTLRNSTWAPRALWTWGRRTRAAGPRTRGRGSRRWSPCWDRRCTAGRLRRSTRPSRGRSCLRRSSADTTGRAGRRQSWRGKRCRPSWSPSHRSTSCSRRRRRTGWSLAWIVPGRRRGWRGRIGGPSRRPTAQRRVPGRRRRSKPSCRPRRSCRPTCTPLRR